MLHVIYLVFNEGYAASAGDALTRPALSGEAIRLGRRLVALLPEAEAQGLLARMLLHEARRAARTSPEGDIVPLEEQDRALWDHAQIAEGTTLVESLLHANLLDELMLMLHPVVIGKGKRLFTDGSALKRLKLADSKTSSTGVLIVTYRPSHESQER